MTNKQSNIFSKKIGLNIRFKNTSYIIRNILPLEEFESHKKQARFAREFMFTNIEFLKTIKSYRGSRHRKLLPVRGQRTHTNAKTNRKKYK